MTPPLDFDAYFSAVHGHAPFPWQRRLAEGVVAHGRWPPLLDLPTGVGKTSALDVALFALAARPEDMPRRILFVVDRRIIVDQAAEHARGIQRALLKGRAREVAARLRATFEGTGEDPPFEVAVLRGGMPKETDWAHRPDRPVVALSTVDQVGSRLLFRGYGVSARMAPVHAGLMGNDVLFLLDEVHLAIPFKETLQQIEARWRREGGLRRPFQFVQMSATPADSGEDRFALNDADRSHEVLARRLGASKPTRLLPPVKVRGHEPTRRRTLGEQAAHAARNLVVEGARCVGVVLNRVDSARHAWATLSHDGDLDVCLVTGRMRDLDRAELVEGTLLPRAGAERNERSEERNRTPMVVVATQTIEAGADLDFDGLVTECASLDALKQRFGRLNRRGALDTAPGRIVVRSDQAQDSTGDPVYGPALARTWQTLREVGEELDFGISAFPVSTRGDLLVEKETAPVVLETHLDCWAQTSPIPEPDPDVSLWLHGPRDVDIDVQIVWRSDVTEEALETATVGFHAWVTAALAARPPRTNEALSIPIDAAESWLRNGPEAEIADAIGASAVDPERRRRSVSESRRAVLWNGEEAVVFDAAVQNLSPGATVVVPCERGGLTAKNWDPTGREAVVDLGDRANEAMGRAVLGLSATNLLAYGLHGDLQERLRQSSSEDDDLPMSQVIEAWWTETTTGEAFEALRPETKKVVDGLGVRPRSVTYEDAERGPVPIALYAKASAVPTTVPTTEDDDSSFVDVEPVTLRQHGADVLGWAQRFVSNLHVPETIAQDVCLAAWFHDIGKADPRFQRWLLGGDDVRPTEAEFLAKSASSSHDRVTRNQARRRAGYPSSERHELLSVAMLERTTEALAKAHDPDLVLHLVGSHHGWCRPFAPPVDPPDDLDVTFELEGITLHATTRHGAAACDSGVGDRFWRLTRRFGWWGLAWLEALVRLADHRASERGSP